MSAKRGAAKIARQEHPEVTDVTPVPDAYTPIIKVNSDFRSLKKGDFMGISMEINGDLLGNYDLM